MVVLPVGQAGGELGLTWASLVGTEEQADGRIAGDGGRRTNRRTTGGNQLPAWGSAPGSPQ